MMMKSVKVSFDREFKELHYGAPLKPCRSVHSPQPTAVAHSHQPQATAQAHSPPTYGYDRTL